MHFLSNSNPICWYPSAGNDWMAYRHWASEYGNSILPKTYVYTDIKYSGILGSSIEKDNGFIDIPKDVFTEYSCEPYNVTALLNSSVYEWKLKYITENIKNILNSEDEIELFNLGIINTEDLFEELDDYIHNNINLLINDEFLLNKYHAKEVSVHEIYGYLDKNKMGYKHFWKDEINIYLLPCSNESFYYFCAINNIVIDTIMANRPMDEFITADKIPALASRIGCKEIIANNNLILNCNHQLDFNWYDEGFANYHPDKGSFKKL
jgi:hypothetical protein